MPNKFSLKWKKFSMKLQRTLKQISTVKILVSKVLNDINVTYHFKQICEKSTIKVNKEIAINLLETRITLYIRVRAHSFPKSVREKHKAASKKGSLRTEMKKACCSKDLGH